MEYFRVCEKLPEPIVLIYKGAEWHFNDVHDLEAFAGKDIDQRIWTDRFSEYTTGKNIGVQPDKIQDKFVFGKSGHMYTYRDN